jgi:hypothetical protein
LLCHASCVPDAALEFAAAEGEDLLAGALVLGPGPYLYQPSMIRARMAAARADRSQEGLTGNADARPEGWVGPLRGQG